MMEALELPLREIKPLTRSEGVYLRLPLLMRDREAKELVCRLSREVGAGVSANYPTTIQDIPELAGRIKIKNCPGAQEVVDRLVTMPTHRFVKEKDIEKIDHILGRKTSSADSLLGRAGLRDETAHDSPCSMSAK